MRAAIRRFLLDESGAAVADLALIASVLVLGSVLGIAVVRLALDADNPAAEVRSTSSSALSPAAESK